MYIRYWWIYMYVDFFLYYFCFFGYSTKTTTTTGTYRWRYTQYIYIAILLWLAFRLHTDTYRENMCVTLVRLSHRWELKMLFIYHIECNGKVGYNKISYTINGIFSISFYLSKIVFAGITHYWVDIGKTEEGKCYISHIV